MAVTIHQSPAAYSPSDNPLVFVFSSNQTAQANFLYRVRTYLNGNLVGTDDVFVQVSTRAMFDASKIVKSLVPSPEINQAMIWTSGKLQSLFIRVTEVYGTTPIEQAMATSSVSYTWKACVSDAEFTLGFAAYTTATRKFLTRMPRQAHTLLRTQDTGLALITRGMTSYSRTVTAYDSDGVSLGSFSSSSTLDMIQFNLKSSVVAAALGVTESAIASVSITGDELETLTFTYWDGCGECNALIWLNDLGGWDTMVFEHNKRLSGGVEPYEYIKPFGAWSGTSFVFNLQNSGVKTVFTKQTDKGVISTDYIGQAYQNWLTEIFKSPIHLLYSTNDIPKPITPTSRQFEKQQSRFEELISLDVAFNYDNQNNGLTL
jgi:hypothetical protein